MSFASCARQLVGSDVSPPRVDNNTPRPIYGRTVEASAAGQPID